MPRRPPIIEQDIPLYLIPHTVLRGVRMYGNEIERVVVKKTCSHFYNVSIRTRPVKRELRKGLRRSGSKGDCSDGGEKV
jgi:hypothetical protein